MMENASVALLMLDIASAKSTLTQLQQTFTAADVEHQRTRSQLQHLQDQKQDVHPLYTQLGGKGTAALADRATAQQLQALHTENLQLKSLLKQEINAREQLASQHAALLELLRSHGLQDILTADQLDSGAVSTAANSKRQQAFLDPLAGTAGAQQTATGPLSVGTAAAVVPDQQPLLNSVFAEATIPVVRMPAAGHPEKGNITFSSSSTFEVNAAAGAGASTAGCRRSQAEAMCPSSAYFPQQQLEQQQQRLSRQGSAATNAAHETAADACCRASHPAAEGVWHGANSRPAKGSIPRQLFSQHDQRHAQQQQQQQQQQHHQQHHRQQQRQSAPQFVDANWEQLGVDDATATYAATHGGSSTTSSSSSGSSYSSSCSHSQASEQLLDSDDLEELATLCDGLISQTQGFDESGRQQQQHVQHRMAGHAGAATAAATAAAAAACTAARSHSTGPDSSSYLRSEARADLQQQQQHLQRTHSQPMWHPDVALPQPQTAVTPPVNLTDIEQLAARLQQLQQQVTAAGFTESGPMQRSSIEGGMPASARPAGACGSSAAQQQQQQQHPGTQGARQTSSHSGLNSAASSVTGARSGAGSSNGGNVQQQQQQQLSGESSSVADLQQQLAQRMQEVKQRLRNICNGMLEEALTGSARAKASDSTTTPAADEQPPAAADQGFEAWRSQPVQQQQQSGAPAAASAGAGAQDSMALGASQRRSSSSTNVSGSGSSPVGPVAQQQQQQPAPGHDQTTCAQDNAGVGGVRWPVAFTLHAHAAPAPGAGTDAGGPLMRGPAGGGKLRQRVVQGFWAGDAAQQAAGAGSAAAVTAPGPTGVRMQAGGGAGGVCAHAAASEAAVGHDVAYSESSWSTLDDEEDHASNKQQYEQEQQQQQQQPEIYPEPLGDEAVTPPRGGSKSRSASGRSSSADESSPSGSSPPMPHQQHCKQHHSGPWRPQRHADMSQSLEGVLFSMGGRISGEVLQTFSPLKTMPAVQSFWLPGSPLTPIKQGKP